MNSGVPEDAIAIILLLRVTKFPNKSNLKRKIINNNTILTNDTMR